jgi:inosine-uridine nucleoside N-ribohydrolase
MWRWPLVLLRVLGGACASDAETTATTTPSTASTASTVASVPTASSGATTTNPIPDAGVPMVVDTDLASDDIVALLYLLSDPTVDIRAITVSGTGEVTCPRGEEVARGLLAVMDRDDVPVACGTSTPLAGARVFPEEWRKAADNAYGLVLRRPPAVEEQDAVELLTSAIGGSPSPVTLLTLGPLTDVAEAFAADPSLAADLESVVVMGGAVDVPGNVQPEGADQPLAAEWNLYIDPAAASAVLGSDADVTLVALDATNEVPVPADLVARVQANDRTEATSHVADLLSRFAPPFLWDPLAAIAAAHPELVPTASRTITVTTEGDDSGSTTADPDGRGIQLAGRPDAGAVIDHLLRTLAGVGDDEPLAPPTTLAVVGDVVVGLEGETCTFDGPTSLSSSGAIRVTQTPGSVPYLVLVAHLVQGATIEETITWAESHPGETPPMVDRVEAIGEGALASPAIVAVDDGDNAVVCALRDERTIVAAVITVGGREDSRHEGMGGPFSGTCRHGSARARRARRADPHRSRGAAACRRVRRVSHRPPSRRR